MALSKNFGGFSETFERVFDPNPRVGKGSGLADIFNVIADFATARREADARKEQTLQMKLEMAKQIYGDDQGKWPLELKADLQKRYGLYGQEGEPLRIKQPAKKNVKTREAQEEYQPPTPKPDEAQMRMERQGFGNRAALAEGIPTPPKQTRTVQQEYVEEVPQEDILLPTTKKESYNGQDVYTPTPDPYKNLTLGQISQITNMPTPPGMNLDIRASDLAAMGMSPMQFLQQQPSASDMMNAVNAAQQNYAASLTAENPNVVITAYNSLSNSVTALRKTYPAFSEFLPVELPGLETAIARWSEGISYLTPPKAMATALTLGQAIDEELVRKALLHGPDAALDWLQNGIMPMVDSDQTIGKLMPIYQIEDRQVLVTDGTGKPILDAKGNPQYRTVQGLRSALNALAAEDSLKHTVNVTGLAVSLGKLRQTLSAVTGYRKGSGPRKPGDEAPEAALWAYEGKIRTNEAGRLSGFKNDYQMDMKHAWRDADLNVIREGYLIQADGFARMMSPDAVIEMYEALGMSPGEAEARYSQQTGKTKKGSKSKPGGGDPQAAAEEVLSGYGA